MTTWCESSDWTNRLRTSSKLEGGKSTAKEVEAQWKWRERMPDAKTWVNQGVTDISSSASTLMSFIELLNSFTASVVEKLRFWWDWSYWRLIMMITGTGNIDRGERWKTIILVTASGWASNFVGRWSPFRIYSDLTASIIRLNFLLYFL